MSTEKKEPDVVIVEKGNALTAEDQKINLSDLPSMVSNQVEQIRDLSVKVKQAMKSAKQAKESAENAKRKSTGFGHKKEAIEALQSATMDVVEAQISAAEAQETSFQYQQQLSEITKKLFGLGILNIAANRTVVRELELRLQNASEEELSELAKKEICNVVKQLKAQEDIMEKQATQGQALKELSISVSSIKDKDLAQDRLIEEGAQKDNEQDQLIEEQAKKDEEHDRLIAEQAEKDEEHDRLIAEQAEKDEEHDRLIENQGKKLRQQEDRINTLEKEVEALKAELARKSGKMLTYFSVGIAALATLLSILHYFL